MLALTYTDQCCSKGFRIFQSLAHDDLRMTLIGNSWHVGVVSLLLQPWFFQFDLIPHRTPQEVMDLLRPGSCQDLSGFLFRGSFSHPRPFQSVLQTKAAETLLVQKLGHLVSTKGTDVMLTSSTEPLPHSHRMRNSLNPKL